MSTFIDGIGQCQVIDKSGELVDLKGHDITSLDKTGVFNWEHQANTPATLVGKILKAKKIFSKDDCENERHVYWWNKCNTPYLYVMGELLDDYTASAKECAGQMRYSRDNPGQAPLLGFSIEGSEIPNTRKGMVITRSIGRKCTLTVSPCNSMCMAEIFEGNQKPQIKDDFEEIFKTEDNAITLFKSGEGAKIYEQYLAKKESMEYLPKGSEIGMTKSEKSIYSHGKIEDYGFNPSEHKEAAEHHRHAAVTSEDPKLADHHIEQMKLHNHAAINGGKKHMAKNEKVCSIHKAELTKSEQPKWSAGKVDKKNDAVHYSHPEHGVVSIQKKPSGEFHVKHAGTLAGVGGKKGIFNNPKEAGMHARKYMDAVSQKKILPQKPQSHPSPSMLGKTELKKAITAGGMNAAPSTLVNGSAYQTEGLSSKPSNAGADNHNFQATKKKDWNKRAKSDYQNWPHREKFENFMRARMPHLADGEIRAIGRTIALSKSIDLEKSLNDVLSLAKAEDPSKKKTFNPKIRQLAEQHMASKGVKLEHPGSQAKVNPEFASKVASAYHNMKHDPGHPDVKRSYDALKRETADQYKAIKNSGLKVSQIKPGMANPYKNSKDTLHDIHANNHLWYFPTESGFGSDPSKNYSDHPMLEPTNEVHEGKPMLANDMFRIVHDYFGHAKEGNGFGPHGEENAWQNHARMYSPEAQRAMTTETRGQNSWVNFGPHGEQNRANPSKTIYADQKAGLLPDWAHEVSPKTSKK